ANGTDALGSLGEASTVSLDPLIIVTQPPLFATYALPVTGFTATAYGVPPTCIEVGVPVVRLMIVMFPVPMFAVYALLFEGFTATENGKAAPPAFSPMLVAT